MSSGYVGAVKRLLIGIAVGAALVWYFDPDNGPDRRTALRARYADLTARLESGRGREGPSADSGTDATDDRLTSIG